VEEELNLNTLYIGLGGLSGAVLRYFISLFLYKKTSSNTPYWSYFLNMIVCFMLGFGMVILNKQTITVLNPLLIKNLLLTFFITFSIFSYKAIYYFKKVMLIQAATVLFYNLFAGLLFLTIGNLIAQSI
jgi:CrcB protein